MFSNIKLSYADVLAEVNEEADDRPAWKCVTDQIMGICKNVLQCNTQSSDISLVQLMKRNSTGTQYSSALICFSHRTACDKIFFAKRKLAP